MGWLIAWRWDVDHLAAVATGAAGIFAFVFYSFPATRRPIHRAFSIGVYPIQLIATITLLGIVYFGVLTPIGICLRLSGYDPLHRLSKTDAGGSSTYWVKRDPTPPDERYFKTY